MAKKKGLKKKGGEPKEEKEKIVKKGKTVTLWDVNENSFTFPAYMEEDMLKSGFRKTQKK